MYDYHHQVLCCSLEPSCKYLHMGYLLSYYTMCLANHKNILWCVCHIASNIFQM